MNVEPSARCVWGFHAISDKYNHKFPVISVFVGGAEMLYHAIEDCTVHIWPYIPTKRGTAVVFLLTALKSFWGGGVKSVMRAITGTSRPSQNRCQMTISKSICDLHTHTQTHTVIQLWVKPIAQDSTYFGQKHTLADTFLPLTRNLLSSFWILLFYGARGGLWEVIWLSCSCWLGLYHFSVSAVSPHWSKTFMPSSINHSEVFKLFLHCCLGIHTTFPFSSFLFQNRNSFCLFWLF